MPISRVLTSTTGGTFRLGEVVKRGEIISGKRDRRSTESRLISLSSKGLSTICLQRAKFSSRRFDDERSKLSISIQ